MCKNNLIKEALKIDAGNVKEIQRDLSLLDDGLRELVLCILEDCKYHNLPFEAFETGRTIERQKWLMSEGRSRTLKSKHIIQYYDHVLIKKSKAVDFVLHYDLGGIMVWSWGQIGSDAQKKRDIGYYYMLEEMIKSRYDTIKNKNKISRIVWGGLWSSIVDLPHYQID